MNLQEMLEESKRYDAEKTDVIGSSLLMNPDGSFQVGGRQLDRNMGHPSWNAPTLSTMVSMNDNALTQAMSFISRAEYGKGSKSLPTQYIMNLPEGLRHLVFNHHAEKLAATRKSELMFRLFGPTVRAVVHRDYPRIWNSDIVEMVTQIVADIEANGGEYEGFTLNRPWVNEDYVHIPFYFESIHSGPYYVGGLIRHAENGAGGLQLISATQNTRCKNSYTEIDKAEIIRHTQYRDSASIMGAIVNTLPTLLRSSAELALKATEAEQVEFPNISALLDGIAEDLGLNHEQKSQLILGMEGRNTQAAVADGVTFMAHQSFVNPHKRHEIECYGGHLITAEASEFERLIKLGSERVRVRA